MNNKMPSISLIQEEIVCQAFLFLRRNHFFFRLNEIRKGENNFECLASNFAQAYCGYSLSDSLFLFFFYLFVPR